MRGLRRIRAAENALEEVISKAFREVLAELEQDVNPDVLTASISKHQAAVLLALWRSKVGSDIAPAVLSVYRKAAASTLSQFGAVIGLLPDNYLDNVRNVRADAYLAAAVNRISGFGDQAFEEVTLAAQQALIAGEGAAKLADRLQEAVGVARNRALTIARTEAAAAVNGADHAVGQEFHNAGLVTTRTWLCVLPDTPVTSVNATHASRRHYEGPVVRLTTRSGSNIATTPNHEILTGRGWQRAGDVKSGDQLLKVLRGDLAGAPEVNTAKTGIGDYVDALFQAQASQVRTMPTGVHLDGDVTDTQIQVVPVQGALLKYLESGPTEEVSHLVLVAPDDLSAARLAMGLSTTTERVGGDGGPDHSLAAGGSLGLPLSRAHLAGSQNPSLAPIAEPNTGFDQKTGDGWAGGPQGLTDSRDRITRLVSLDDVISAEVESFSGHVYDLSTESNWYVAAGVIVHNSTHDHRTRHSHQDADGQTVGMQDAFQVGGYDLQYPGDPSGPASQIVNCRCSTTLGVED